MRQPHASNCSGVIGIGSKEQNLECLIPEEATITLSKLARQRKGIKTIWYPEWEPFMMAQIQDALTKKISVKSAISASAAEARRLAKG